MVWPARRRSLSLGSVLVAFITLGCSGKSSSFDDRRGEPQGRSGSFPQAGNSATGGSGGSVLDAGMGGTTTGGATSGGTGGGSAGSGNAGGAPAVDISGAWAMFSFEDPVAVSLAQDGTTLSGRGCCAGLAGSLTLDCCGQIADGSIVGRRAKFGFSFELGELVNYSADVTVSEDGRRMLGWFSRITWPMAWVRLEGPALDRGWLMSNDSVLAEAVASREGRSSLALTAAPMDGRDYDLNATYELTVVNTPVPMLRGDFGPFWAGEMQWLETEQALAVGPVPATDPAFPVGLRLRYEGDVLADVEVTKASGARYLFRATPE